jgi:hypothetical protein
MLMHFSDECEIFLSGNSTQRLLWNDLSVILSDHHQITPTQIQSRLGFSGNYFIVQTHFASRKVDSDVAQPTTGIQNNERASSCLETF